MAGPREKEFKKRVKELSLRTLTEPKKFQSNPCGSKDPRPDNMAVVAEEVGENPALYLVECESLSPVGTSFYDKLMSWCSSYIDGNKQTYHLCIQVPPLHKHSKTLGQAI